MVGMWIAFAFAAGMVLVGFKSRQLKWYEFIVSCVFALLLDRLVFGGQIGTWIGHLGSKAQGAAGHGALSQGAMMLPFLLPGRGGKARRLAAKVWTNRPGIGDTLFYVA